jgi:hypothetical protein
MKSLFVFFLLLFAWSASQAGGDSVFVVVQGDTVQIWDTPAHTNCCSLFDFDITVSNDTITWIERDTSHQACKCYCSFDFNATIIGLDAGSYVVEVYRSSIVPQEITAFIGSVSFVKGPTTVLYRTMRQYQSTCGALGLTDRERAFTSNFNLERNYPNPFNPSTRIEYTLPVQSLVRFAVYNLLGQVVADLVGTVQEAGVRYIEWNAAGIPSGIYFCRLDATSVCDPAKHFSQTRKMVLIK